MSDELRRTLMSAAQKLGISPIDLATIVSYETAGTFDPTKRGPTTKWGTHRGLIQWGEPQAQKYLGGDFSIPKQGEGIVAYMRDTGVKPGMGILDVYSAVNAGRVGRYNASDTAAGGAPGTVRDKVEKQMGPHRRKAEALMGSVPDISPDAQDFVNNNPQPGGYGTNINDPNQGSSGPVWGTMGPQAVAGAPMTPPLDGPLPGHVLEGMNPDPITPGDRIGGFLKGIASMFDVPAAPRPPAHPGGPSPAQANALSNVMNNPTLADALLRKRLPFA